MGFIAEASFGTERKKRLWCCKGLGAAEHYFPQYLSETTVSARVTTGRHVKQGWDTKNRVFHNFITD